MSWPEAMVASVGILSGGAVLTTLFMAAGGKWYRGR